MEKAACSQEVRGDSWQRERAVLFWEDETGATALSDNNEQGLKTCVQVAGFEVVLYVYGAAPTNLPDGVQVLQAGALLPRSSFMEILKKLKVAVAADLVRLLGIQAAFSQDSWLKYAWLSDMDTLWVVDIRTARRQLDATAFDHVIATAQNLPTCRAGTEHAMRNGMRKFLLEPWDVTYSATPVGFRRDSPLLELANCNRNTNRNQYFF